MNTKSSDTINLYTLIALSLFLFPFLNIGSWLVFQIVLGAKNGVELWRNIMPGFITEGNEVNIFKINLLLAFVAFCFSAYAINLKKKFKRNFNLLSIIILILSGGFTLLISFIFYGS